MLKFKVFQGAKMGLASQKNMMLAVERAASEATKWINDESGAIEVAHIAAVAPGEHQVAHVVVWYEEVS